MGNPGECVWGGGWRWGGGVRIKGKGWTQIYDRCTLIYSWNFIHWTGLHNISSLKDLIPNVYKCADVKRGPLPLTPLPSPPNLVVCIFWDVWEWVRRGGGEEVNLCDLLRTRRERLTGRLLGLQEATEIPTHDNKDQG